MSRTLSSLAHALSAASDMETALVSLSEALAELDRSARLALLRYEGRRALLRERLVIGTDGKVMAEPVGTTIDHLPTRLRTEVMAGADFVDVGDQSDEIARLIGVGGAEGGLLALRGLRVDGQLAAVVSLYEPRRIFGTRVMERFAPYVALFDLAYARFADREAREEAVRTLEDVTQRVHDEYLRKLATLEQELATMSARLTPVSGMPTPEEWVAREREMERLREDARRAGHRADAVEGQVAAAVDQLERAHIELHRRSETLRQKIRTIYLIDRVLTLDASTTSPRELVEGLVALLGDDMQAQRCSMLLRSPEGEELYLAAARGLPPAVAQGYRVAFGEGVAGKVAVSREPLLVRDVQDAARVPMLKDQYFTTGSFISFPLIYHDELIGVINLTNRAQRGVYVEEDVDRVRLLALVISLIASHAALPERLMEEIRVG